MMPTADERLALIRTKVERAKKHIGDLEREIRAFLETNPYVVSLKPHNHIPHTKVYYLVKAEDPPAVISAITGDALFNLRAALDHLAYQLAEVNGTTSEKILRATCFPISDDAAKYKAEAPGKVKGMSQAAIKAIDACKPYKGGNDPLWHLHKLNNIDKHRFVITVGSAISVQTLPRHLKRMIMENTLGRTFSDAEVDAFYLTLEPSGRKCPLKTGDILGTDLAAVPEPGDEIDRSDEHQNTQFYLQIAFGEAGILESEPVLETLKGMTDLIDNLITDFKPLLV
jgi:hypothetical protein